MTTDRELIRKTAEANLWRKRESDSAFQDEYAKPLSVRLVIAWFGPKGRIAGAMTAKPGHSRWRTIQSPKLRDQVITELTS